MIQPRVTAHQWLAAACLLAMTICSATLAQVDDLAPARIAMFHEGKGSHDSGQMRQAAQALNGLAVIDEFAPGAENPIYGPDVDLGAYDLVFVDASDVVPLTEEELSEVRARTSLLVLSPDDVAQGNVSLV